MRRTPFALAAAAALSLALAPGLADARVGGGTSSGSRGSNTFSAPPTTRTAPTAAQPLQRTITPNTPTPSPGYGAPAAAASPSAFGGRSGFMSGLAGGLIGVGLGGLLFGHGFMGGGGMGFSGFFGLLLQIGLIALLIYFAVRLFRRHSPALAGGPNIYARNAPPTGPGPMAGGGGGGPRLAPVAINEADYQAYEQLLRDIQAAWSVQDLSRLRALVTPEMLSYFGEQLAEQTSRGVRNEVSDVRLLQGDLSEAWAEQGREYATVAMRFSMIDVTRDQAGRVVDGSPTEAVTATELWTFVRSQGGRWILSAIQQVR